MDFATRAKRYAVSVVSGKTPACRWVRLACQRHLEDLKRKKWEFHFDPEKGNRVCEFIEGLQHVKGRWNTRTIVLEDWQCFILCVVFGWVDAEGFRRFRTVYVEVPRKNAKTTICAAVGLYMLAADDEEGAEIYSAATTEKQARNSMDIARQMAKKDEDLRSTFGIEPLANSIVVEGLGGYWHTLSRESQSIEGWNIHCAIVDELHAHKTREVWDSIDQGTGSRKQPLKWIITTAGSDMEGICYEIRTYITEVLAGRHAAERHFGIIYTLDEADDWTDEDAHRKANPNYGSSVLVEDLQTACDAARASARSQNTFKTKRCNLWVSVGTAYFNRLAWDGHCRADIMESDFHGRPCWFALDLASKRDVAALIRLYETEPKRYAVFGSYYLPENVIEKGQPNYDLYAGYSKAGLLTLTPGDIIDFEFIEEDLLEHAELARPEEVCYDPYQATELATRMTKEGLTMVDIPMNMKRLSEPMKSLEALITTAGIQHDGNPILSWMIGNVMAKEDPKENVYPTKEHRHAKIDGAVSIIMGLSRALVYEETYISPVVRATG